MDDFERYIDQYIEINSEIEGRYRNFFCIFVRLYCLLVGDNRWLNVDGDINR